MESPSEEKRRSHVITIDPDETVLTAYPYRPHNTLLDFLKGEPKLLGAIQILLSLFIVVFGIILALNFIFLSKKFPLVILTGYPLWGAVIFFLAGFVIMSHNNVPRQLLKQDVTTMNILSLLTALAGIALILLSFKEQHKFCQTASPEGPCVVGKTFFLGILSILLIITIVELSIAVTVVFLRSRCWTGSKEAVFFFPSDGPQNTEHPAPEENNTLQFEFQEKSSGDNAALRINGVFLGGYAFFKLRVSRNPSAPKTIPQKSDKGTSSMHVPEEQEAIPLVSPEQETKLNALPPPLTPHSSENTLSPKDSRTDHLNDEDLSSIIHQPSDMQSNLIGYETASAKSLQTPSSHNFLHFSPDNLSSQSLMASLSTQVLQSKQPSFHISQSYDISEDFLSENIPFQDNQSQGTPSQYTPSQEIQFQDILAQDISFQEIQSQETPYQDTVTQDILYQKTPPQETPSQETPYQELSYQDILIKDTSPQESPYQYILTKETPFQETLFQGNLSKGTPSQDTPSQGTPSKGTLSQVTSPKETPSQGTPSQVTPTKGTLSQGTLSQGTPSQETPYQGTPSQGTPPQGTPSEGTPYQGTPSQETPPQESPSEGTPSQETAPQGTPSERTLSKGTPSQGTPSQRTPPKEQSFQDIQTKDTSSQETPYQETPFQDTLIQNIPSQDTQYKESPSQEIFFRDSPFQNTPSQNIQYQDILSQEKLSQSSQTQNTVPQDMPFSDLQILNTQVQIQQYPEVFYRDIRTEVMELTQEWKSNQGKKPTRRLSLSLPGKHGQPYPKRHSVDLQVKSEKPRRYSEDLQSKRSRRKSIDQQIKAWISPKKNTTEKQDAYTQTTEQAEDQQAQAQQAQAQQADDQQAKEEEVPVQQYQNKQIKVQKSVQELLPEERLNDREDEDQQSDKKQPPEEQVQLAEDQHPKEQKAPKTQLQNWQGGQQALVKRAPMQLYDNWDSQSFQCTERSSCSFWSTPSWQPISQRSQDWISQGWRNKDWKAQEWQFEVQPSLEWESQELLERESLRQRALYQQIQPHTTIVHQTPDHRLQNFILQVGLCQGSRQQQDSGSSVLIEDVYEDDIQSRDREPGDTEDTCQKPTDQQSEDMRPDNYPVACQSLVPYTYVTCLSNIASEQEVQNNTPCSGSSKDLNATSSSSYQKDQQQSGDSD
uniref:membrane-spanning 4-domains subfamily A member 14 isoform X2 n=1 Tax=Arvicanthis niloticus TaxID=61156 RepID=UPI001485F5BE|nr:membrane-spanning 4-domains subfamily A member 14 isoform X2 [Arvicanthis niloticus]